MNYLQRKKLALFMNFVRKIKGFAIWLIGIPPLTLPDCVDNNSIINYTIGGNSVQNGTPTPENPVEVESVGEYDEETGKYKIPVKCSGKNLFDINNLKGNSYVTNNNDGTITVTRYSANSGAKLKQLCPDIKVGDSVVFSMKTAGNPLIYLSCGINWNNTSRKTITQEMLDSNVFFYTSVNDSNTPVIISNIQMERDTLSDYEPYREPITSNIYLDEPLRKVGSVADTIDFENQKVVRNVGVKEYTENDSYVAYYNTSLSFYGYYSRLNTMKVGNRQFGLCTYIQNKGEAGQIWFGAGGNNIMYFSLPDVYNKGSNATESVQAVKDWMASLETPFLIYYPLAEPTETPISLPKLSTIKGTTIYSIDTKIQPSNMEVSYYSTAKE